MEQYLVFKRYLGDGYGQNSKPLVALDIGALGHCAFRASGNRGHPVQGSSYNGATSSAVYSKLEGF
jgi:hypothetical protein